MNCDECGEARPDVTVRQDPLAWEVWDEDRRVPLCDPCTQDRADAV
ncbi:hypothetical protein [Streptomyces albus]|nr:hypothetical protein [Streptomyces albus]GHJ19173.1 hypothetical protein TPA0909_07870 [Streptomyces albus]